MVRRIVTNVLMFVACSAIGLRVLVPAVSAQAAAASPSGEPYSLHIYQTEVDNYNAAIQNCSTPSLECLVRNVTRMVAIEWIANILGTPSGYKFTNEPSPGARYSVTPTGTTPVFDGGLIGGAGRMITALYMYQPASTGRYVADVMDNAGLAPPAYAQGIGFSSLDPVLSLWKMFRNVAYFFFIGVFIVIGFMIMFRQKFGQSAITMQQALPSIIISLILVTFSYAISGILIDIMYLSMYLIVGLFANAGGGLGQEMINMNILQLGWFLIDKGAFDWGNNVNAVTQIINSLTYSTSGSGVGSVVGLLGGITLSIVLAIAILFGLVKLFFELLKSYASILLGVIFAPIYLMMGAFPGRNAFMPWVKNMIANLAAFPTVLLFAIIFKIFIDGTGRVGEGGFMPPYLFGNGQGSISGYLVGIAILLAMPEIVKEMKKRLGASDGIGSMLMSTSANRLGKGADLGLPFMSAGIEGSRRAGVGAVAAVKAGRTNPHYQGLGGIWRGMTQGVETTIDGKTYRTGGGKYGLTAGFGAGQRARRWIDDIRDGRLFQPDNLRAQLERIEKGQKGEKEANKNTSAQPPPTVDPNA